MARAVPIHKLTRPNAPLRKSALVLLVRLQEMFDWSTTIRDPANVSELHNMRIAAKRLRYTMELFAPCFGREFARILKTVEDIQEQIGAIHDCDVLVPLLNKALDKETEREKKRALRPGGTPPQYLAAEGIVPLISAKLAERDRRYNEFIAFWEALPPEGLLQELSTLIQGTPETEPAAEESDAPSADADPDAAP